MGCQSFHVPGSRPTRLQSRLYPETQLSRPNRCTLNNVKFHYADSKLSASNGFSPTSNSTISLTARSSRPTTYSLSNSDYSSCNRGTTTMQGLARHGRIIGHVLRMSLRTAIGCRRGCRRDVARDGWQSRKSLTSHCLSFLT